MGRLRREGVIDIGVRPLSVIGLFIALEEVIDLTALKSMSVEELNMKYDDIQIHLTARCAGLLEIATCRSLGKVRQDSQICYMHRTARDFLEQGAQWTKFSST